MKKFQYKKTALSVAIAAGTFTFSTSSHAFIGGALDIATEHTQVISWAAQYIQMVQEYQQLVKTYNSLNGIRGMASLVNNPALRHYLPDEYQDILSKGFGNWIQLRAAIDDPIGGLKLDKNRRDQVAIDEAMALESYRQASRRFKDIQVLLDKVNAAPDAKDIADLQGRIQAEQVMMQNESVKLAMFKNLQDIQQRKMDEQTYRNSNEMLKKKGVIAEIPSAANVFGAQAN